MPEPEPAREPLRERMGGFISLVKLATSPMRLAVLVLLADGGMNVGDICEELGGGSQPAVSHQLSLLRRGGLVDSIRDRREVHYRLTDRGRAFVQAISTLADSPHLRRRPPA